MNENVSSKENVNMLFINIFLEHDELQHLTWNTYQLPRRVIFADGYTLLRAAGTLPEKAGRTVLQVQMKIANEKEVYQKILVRYIDNWILCIEQVNQLGDSIITAPGFIPNSYILARIFFWSISCWSNQLCGNGPPHL